MSFLDTLELMRSTACKHGCFHISTSACSMIHSYKQGATTPLHLCPHHLEPSISTHHACSYMQCVQLLPAGSPPSLWAHVHLPYSWLCGIQISYCVDMAGIAPPLTLVTQKHDANNECMERIRPSGEDLMCIQLQSWLCTGYNQ